MSLIIKRVFVFFLFILVLVSIVLIYQSYTSRLNQVKTIGNLYQDVSVSVEKNSSQNTFNSSTSKVEPIYLSLKSLWFGDVFWGRYVDDWSKASDLKTAYPFSGLNSFNRQNYDAWIAGLECPITDKYVDSTTQDNTLSFSCPVEYTSEAAKWFNVFTLANNHTDNMGIEGFDSTRKNLEENNIQYFGTYDNANKQDVCEIVSLPTRLIYPENTLENLKSLSVSQNLPIALCGFHNIFKLPTEDEMAVITEYSKYFPTFVLPHQGKEYTYKADSLQQDYARKAIDLGADAVIGNHVHSVQNTEVYKGKLIIYSLGNFIFDQQFSPQVTRGIGLDMDLKINYDKNLEGYLKIGESCKTFKDDCLKIAQQRRLVKPKLELKYDIVASDNSGRLAKKANDDILRDLKTNTNWEQTLQDLNRP